MTSATPDSKDLPLRGVVVADFTRILAGPMATMVLADLGADVIKVERPEHGDETRAWGPPFAGDDATYFLSVNRNKRSIALNLKDPDDLDVARRIVGRSRVLVENFRPGVMDSLGLGYDAMRALNPTLLYCSMPAYLDEDLRDMPGNDLMMQAMSGLMSITGGEDGEPAKVGVALLDVIAGLYAASAIAACIGNSPGVGRRIEVGLFEASVAALTNQAANHLTGGLIPRAMGTAHPNIVPYQAFHASDGSFVLAAAGDRQFRATCHAVGLKWLAEDERFQTNAGRIAHRDDLVASLNDHFRTRRVSDWVAVLLAAGVPAGPTRSIDQVFASPEGRAMVVDISDPRRGNLRLVRSPVTVDGHQAAPGSPPRLDEHDAQIRAWLAET